MQYQTKRKKKHKKNYIRRLILLFITGFVAVNYLQYTFANNSV